MYIYTCIYIYTYTRIWKFLSMFSTLKLLSSLGWTPALLPSFKERTENGREEGKVEGK